MTAQFQHPPSPHTLTSTQLNCGTDFTTLLFVPTSSHVLGFVVEGDFLSFLRTGAKEEMKAREFDQSGPRPPQRVFDLQPEKQRCLLSPSQTGPSGLTVAAE